MDNSSLEVLRIATARRHLGGMLVNAIGGSVFDVAIAIIVLRETGSVVAMGVIVMMESLPMIFPGVLIGAFVDRHSPRRMITLGYGGQAIVVSVAAAVLWVDVGSVAVLAGLVFLRSSFDVFARAGTFGAVPSLYGALSPAFNALFRVTWTSASIVGPVVGGFLAVAISPIWLVVIDAISFAVMWSVMMSLPLPRRPLSDTSEVGLIGSIQASVSVFRKLPAANRFLAATVLNEVGLAPALPIALYAVSTVYHQSNAQVGLTNGAMSVGLLLGSVAITLLVNSNTKKLMRYSSLVSVAGAGVMLLPDWKFIALGLLLVYAGAIAFAVSESNLLQRAMPQGELGKVLTSISAMETAFAAASTFVITNVVSSVGLGVGCIVMMTCTGVGVLMIGKVGGSWLIKANLDGETPLSATELNEARPH